MGKLYSIEETAVAARISFASVYAAIRHGNLAKVRRGRRVFVTESAFLAWLKAGAPIQPTKGKPTTARASK